MFSYEVGDLDFSDQDDIPSVSSSTKLTNGTSTGTQHHQVVKCVYESAVMYDCDWSFHHA